VGGRIYAYLKYREGSKTVNKYVGPVESKSVADAEEQVKNRQKMELLLKEVKKILCEWKKVFVQQARELFLDVIKTLNAHQVLSQFILVGSWCQVLYQHYFNEHIRIPAIRTVDLDLLIPNPPKIRENVDVAALLIDMGFEPQTSSLSGVVTYNHPNLAVEFLTPKFGMGKNEAYNIPKLHISAAGFRYLDLLQSFVIRVDYGGMTIQVPEPAVFVLHKHIISERPSRNILKRDKDRQSALELGTYLLSLPEQREKLVEVFSKMPKKWQKNLISILSEHHKDMYIFLKNSG